MKSALFVAPGVFPARYKLLAVSSNTGKCIADAKRSKGEAHPMRVGFLKRGYYVIAIAVVLFLCVSAVEGSDVRVVAKPVNDSMVIASPIDVHLNYTKDLVVTTWTPMITQVAHVEVIINSDPSGAQVWVDSNDWGYAPATVTIEPGSHYITLRKSGFVDYSTTVSFDSNPQTQQSLVYSLVPLEEPTVLVTTTLTEVSRSHYNVKIDSNPPGAQLSVDSRDSGHTPATVSVEPGSHYILLSKPGFRDYSTFVAIGQDSSLSYSLESAEDTLATITSGLPTREASIGTTITITSTAPTQEPHPGTTIPGFDVTILLVALSIVILAVGTRRYRREI